MNDAELDLLLGQLTDTITQRWAFWYDGVKARGWSSEDAARAEADNLKEQGFQNFSAPFRESDRIPTFCADRHVEYFLANTTAELRREFSERLAKRFEGRADILTAVLTCRPRVLAEVLYDTLTAVAR